ncbi:MAG: hypothetical protein ACKO0N_03595, partial [Planctomycetota bacterium]
MIQKVAASDATIAEGPYPQLFCNQLFNVRVQIGSKDETVIGCSVCVVSVLWMRSRIASCVEQYVDCVK